MRISDWSSDVCSSDLARSGIPAFAGRATKEGWGLSFGRTALARFAKGSREMTLEIRSELTCSMGVTDMAASIAWYARGLGCALIYSAEELCWCELATQLAAVNHGLGAGDSVGEGGRQS